MTPERLEIARRFVACKGWVWLPGMAAALRFAAREDCDFLSYRITYVRIGGNLASAASAAPQLHEIGLSKAIPDLDDSVTCAALLVVVRRAWQGMLVTAPNPASVYDPEPIYQMLVVDDTSGDTRVFIGVSEIEALLAALESAP